MAAVTPTENRLANLLDRRRIAVIPVRGVIGGAVRGVDLFRLLEKVRTRDNIAAVVLDIDSPGGSATTSEAMYIAVRRVAAKKPVVAWFRGTGASGAYFLACGATRILTFPSAIVGSIGVISVRPLLVDALKRIGAEMVVTKSGPFKDLGAPWRHPTDAERAKEQQLVDAIFDRFTTTVATARNLNREQLERVTTGEVWLGTEAVQLQLVDGLAETENEAIAAAQELCGLDRPRIARMGLARSVLQRLGVPGAGMGPPGPRWALEIEGWMRLPTPRL